MAHFFCTCKLDFDNIRIQGAHNWVMRLPEPPSPLLTGCPEGVRWLMFCVGTWFAHEL